MEAQSRETTARGARQRERIVEAAAAAFRRRGYAATGMAEIVALSQAPKGSVYHYFPNGKEEIAVAALRHSGEKARATLEALALAHPPAQAIRAYGAMLRQWMAASQFLDGCPVATTILEAAPDNAAIAGAGAQALASWSQCLERALLGAGAAPQRANELGRLAIQLFEGALIQARAARSGEPIDLATRELARLFDEAAARPAKEG